MRFGIIYVPRSAVLEAMAGHYRPLLCGWFVWWGVRPRVMICHEQ